MADNVPMSQAATTSLVTTLQNTDLFALAREDITSETGYRSKVSRVDTMAKKVVNETDYSQLQTTDKKIIGAINEVNAKASQFDNMTATASGSIATFSDGGDDIPVSEYECDIVAQQASGTPTPDNPLPITGFSQADISVCGINLWNEEWEIGSMSETGVDIAGNGFRSKTHIPVLGNTQYYFHKTSNYGNNIYVYFYDENKTYINKVYLSGSSAFTTAEGTKFIRFYIWGNGITYDTYYNDISINYPATDTQYHAYTGNLYTVAFGQTIYGGRLIYENGEWSIEATHEIVDLGTLDWTYATSATGTKLFISNSISNIKSPLVDVTPNIICTIYIAKSWRDINVGETASDGINVFTDGSVRVVDNAYTDANAFKTAMNGVMLVYELATPTIIPITSSTRVKTISGNNNIFSNTGDNSVKYFTENADSLAELIKAFVL